MGLLKKLKIEPTYRHTVSVYILRKSNWVAIAIPHTHIYLYTNHNSQVMESVSKPINFEGIKRTWYKHTKEFYSALKKTTVMSYAGRCKIKWFH